MHPSNKVTLENVKDVVRYHRPTADQSRRHEALSLATEHFITALLENCPDCADRSAAIRDARNAKMTASAAIALEEGHEPAAAPDATTLAPGQPGANVQPTRSDVAPPAQAAPADLPPSAEAPPAPGFAATNTGASEK